jgi:hypothetical protein
MTYNTFDWDIKEGKEKKKELVEEYPSYIELMDWAGRLSTNKITQRIVSLTFQRVFQKFKRPQNNINIARIFYVACWHKFR